MDLNEIKTALKEGLVTIDFTKVNGDRRRMVATWDSSIVPPTTANEGAIRDSNLIVVWDTEHAGWRSIKVDHIRAWAKGVTEVEIPEEPTTTVFGAWQPNTPVPTANT